MSSALLVVALTACGGDSGSSESASAVTQRISTTTTSRPSTTVDTLRDDFTTMQPDSSCLGAFRAAAAVDPGSEFRDRLYMAAGDACPTTEDWLVSLSRFPEAAGLARFEASSALRELELVCGLAPSSKVCLDARRRGFVDGQI
jgi:hypothetical protein